MLRKVLEIKKGRGGGSKEPPGRTRKRTCKRINYDVITSSAIGIVSEVRRSGADRSDSPTREEKIVWQRLLGHSRLKLLERRENRNEGNGGQVCRKPAVERLRGEESVYWFDVRTRSKTIERFFPARCRRTVTETTVPGQRIERQRQEKILIKGRG